MKDTKRRLAAASAQIQTIHAASKKSYLPSHFVLLMVSILNGALFVARLLGDFILSGTAKQKELRSRVFFLVNGVKKLLKRKKQIRYAAVSTV